MAGFWLDLCACTARRAIASGPLVGRLEGQRLAREELARLNHPSVLQRILSWLARLFNSAGNAVPGGWFGLVLLAVLAVLAVTVVVFRVRPGTARRLRQSSVMGGPARSAADYRQSAARLAASGDYGAAIVDGVRAIAAELEEREILRPRPARTADELAAEAGRELPVLAGELSQVTRLFDDVRYGDKAGSPDGYLLVSRVDEAVRSARQAAGAGATLTAASPAVPR